MMHIIAKTSFIFKIKSCQDEVYLNLLFETNCFLNEFAKSEKKNGLYNTVSLQTYVT